MSRGRGWGVSWPRSLWSRTFGAWAGVKMGVTDDRNDPGLKKIDDRGMQEKYLVLSDAEIAKGFVRPVRRSYRHDACGAETWIGPAIAETYARDPHFYTGTYCAFCRQHFPIGVDGEFRWFEADGLTGPRVGV